MSRSPGSHGASCGGLLQRVGPADGTGLHPLRHYYASLLIRHGESIKTVQARLGHATAAETLDTYSHLWPDSDDRTREAVDSQLSESGELCGLGADYGDTVEHSYSAGQRPCADESGCRPGSVPCRCSRRRGDGHPSRAAVADHLQRPTRVLGRAALDRTLSGLAPDGVYRADLVTQVAGGLLHHRFTLAPTTRVVGAVCSLWHCPAGHPGWLLATILPFGARTFLGGGCPPTRPSARLVRRQCRGRVRCG